MTKESKVVSLTLKFNRDEIDALFHIILNALSSNTLNEDAVNLCDDMLRIVNKIISED